MKGNSFFYEFSRLISQREKSRIIKGLEESISLKGREWAEGVLEEACKFPNYRPYFRKIYVDDKQRLYVWHVKSVLDEEGSHEFDLFNREGYYIYRVIIPVLPEIIQNGFIYDINENEETGELRIRRFKIKNWEQIKNGI